MHGADGYVMHAHGGLSWLGAGSIFNILGQAGTRMTNAALHMCMLESKEAHARSFRGTRDMLNRCIQHKT